MSENTFSRLQALLPPSPLLIARVLVVHGDDTSTVELPINAGDTVLAPGLSQGRTLRVRGSAVPAGANAFVRDGLIESQAPDGDPLLVVIGEVLPTPPTRAPLATNGAVPAQFAAVGQPHRLLLAPLWKDGFAPLSYQVTGSLPDGVTLSAATGIVTGEPIAASTGTLTFSATDSTGRNVPHPATAFTVIEDANYNTTSLHLSFSGSVPTDLSEFGHPVTRIGAASITETAARFWPGGLDLSAAGSGLSVPYHASLSLRDADFVVRGWARNPSTSGYSVLVDFRGTAGTGDGWDIFVDCFTQSLAVYDGTIDSVVLLSPARSLPAVGDWFQWACERFGETTTLYIGGVPLASATYNPPVTHATGLKIGLQHDGAAGWGSDLDEIQIKKGEAPYQGAYTPYLGPFACRPQGAFDFGTADLQANFSGTLASNGLGTLAVMGFTNASPYPAKLYYSLDYGATWSSVAQGVDAEYRNTVFGGGKWVAVGGNSFASNKNAYSADGITWTHHSNMPSTSYWYAVGYGNGQFMAAIYNSNALAVSADGVNWSVLSKTGLTGGGDGLAYGNGKWVSCGRNNASIWYSSNDGSSWSTNATQTFNGIGVTFGGGYFTLVRVNTGVLFYSADAITWQEALISATGSWRPPVYANGYWFAVGATGAGATQYAIAETLNSWTVIAAPSGADANTMLGAASGVAETVALLGPRSGQSVRYKPL